MALVSMRELLQDARKRCYAVGGFNVFNLETLGAVVEVAEELKTPLVLGIPERLFRFTDVDTLSAAMVRAAQKAAVPVALHLDHGYTYDGIMKAIRWGFTSVMFDGSNLPFKDNLQRTKEVVRIAHSLGISVEGELGYVACYGAIPTAEGDHAALSQLAADFVRQTRLDALAVPAGSNHGCYQSAAQLDLPRLMALRTSVDIPLVLHGGSKLTREEYRHAIQAGIAKINIATDMSHVAAERLKEELAKHPAVNYINLMNAVKKGIKDSVRRYMLSFDCIAKAV